MRGLQIAALVASLLSSVFWIAAAMIRVRPISLFTLRGPESIPQTIERMSLMNAIAALFAAVATACQGIVLYLGPDS